MPKDDSEVTGGQAVTGEVFIPPPSMSRSAADWATSFIRGLAKGTEGMAGLPGDASDLVGEGVKKLGHAVGLPDPSPETAAKRGTLLPTTETINKTVGGDDTHRNPVGKFLDKKPETTGGRYAESVGEMVPAVAGGEGSLVRKGIQALTGGVGSEAAGQAASSDAAKGLIGDHETAARVLGGIAGQSVPGMVKKAITPFPIKPERQDMVDTLRKEGVEPTAGDVTGSKSLKRAESTLGGAPGAGGAYEEAREKISDQYTRAALKRIGEDADRATPEVMERAATRIGKQFDDLSARNSAKPDMRFATDVLKAQQDYDHLFVDPLKKPVVEKVVENVMNHISAGTIDGKTYQAQRSMLERMRRGYKADPEVSGFLAEVRDALDGVMERSIQKNNPGDLGAWKDVRNQYRNMLTLEKVTSGGGEAAAEGIISPARLRQAAVSTGGKKSYAQGGGDFGELSRSGNALLTQPSSSNTAERGFLHMLAGGLLHPTTWATMLAPGTTGKAIMSKPAQDYLKNQLAAKLDISPSMLDKIVRSALSEHGRQSTELPPITVEGE
jgi:hypothetical protein